MTTVEDNPYLKPHPFPRKEFPECSDEEFKETIALANASYYKWKIPEEEWYRVIIDGRPLQYWLNKLDEKGTGK